MSASSGCVRLSTRGTEIEKPLTVIVQPSNVNREMCPLWDSHCNIFSFTVRCREKRVFLAVLWDSNRL